MRFNLKPPATDRRKAGHAIPLIEKMTAAREISSCCVGVEALLETDCGIARNVERRRKSETHEK